MLAIIFAVLGALIPAYVLWRVGQAICVWLKHPQAPREVPHLIALCVAVPLAALGNANGGPLAWGEAIAVYLPAQVLWYAYGIIRDMRRSPEQR